MGLARPAGAGAGSAASVPHAALAARPGAVLSAA